MSAPGPILGDVIAAPARAPRRPASGARHSGTETISTLAQAEQQIVGAARDLAYLAGELGRVTSQSEERGAALIDAREECGRLSRRLEQLERLAAGVMRRVEAERAASDARMQEVHEQAAAAIRMAEERASASLRKAHELVREVAAAHEATVELAAAAQREAESARQAISVHRTEAQLELAAAHEAAAEREAAVAREVEAAATARAAAEREAESQPTARERRMAVELEHLRRERSEHEERLRADLDLVRTEKLELRTRLSMCEHTLAERERELERERKLADEAMRWASSIERELVLPPPALVPAPAPAPAPAGDCAVKPPADPPIAAMRRRGSRVRLRPAS
jgi:hypothetical protein